MVIVDTAVLVHYFQGVRNAETDWLDVALERQRLGLTDIILCEVLQGTAIPFEESNCPSFVLRREESR